MSVEFGLEKNNMIRYGIVMVLAGILFLAVDYHILALVGFGIVYFLLEAFHIKLNKKVPWVWTLILFGIGAVFTMYMVQYLLLEPELFVKTKAFKLFLNVLCILVVYFVTLFFTNRVYLSACASHGFFMILAFVNYYVYLFRENEFIFPDLRSIGTGLSVAGNYQLTLTDKGCYVILASWIFFSLAWKFQVKFKRPLHMRVISVLVVTLLCITIATNTLSTNTETWEKKGTYRNGYVLNFVLSARDSFVSAPEGYSVDFVEQMEMLYGETKENDMVELEKQPTVIVIMNESFADLSVVGELKTNEPLTPFIDSLEENTIKGYALSSVFGAKTPNCEWEFLTGGSMAFLPKGSVVYQQYMSDEPSSLVYTMKTEGYTCVAMHPYYDTGWSRNLIYPTYGFDEMYFIEDFDQTQLIRKYISDRELYSKIIDRFESKAANESLFMMTITMQNHGGYTESYENFEEKYYKIGRSYTDANQYFSLIRESDDAIRELITYFSNVDEPVEIIFFGDHQPSLNSKFYPILNGKGLSGLTLEQLENLYTVPFFIWTNYDTPEEKVEITSLNFLSTMALERAGFDLPPYHQFLSEFMEVVPAINSQGYYSLEDDRYLHIEDATGEEAKWIEQYRLLQYNNLFDVFNRSDVFYPYYE